MSDGQVSKRERQKRRRAERLRVEATESRRLRRLQVTGTLVVAAVAVVAVSVTLYFATTGPSADEQLADVEDINVTTRQHVQGNVDYPTTPPAGGDHNPVWQNCGFYEEPVAEENAVHSLEHGAVWLAYAPNLPESQQAVLRDMAARRPYVLASPVEDLPTPIVASAWGKLLSVETTDDPALPAFLQRYLQGPQTPEPGAACSGGVGQPSA